MKAARLRLLVWLYRVLPGLISLLVVVSLGIGAVTWIGVPGEWISGGFSSPGEKFARFTANRVSDALQGILALDRIYWIGRHEAAPKPDETRFVHGMPEELADLSQRAEKLLGGQELFFSPEISVSPGTDVQYYLDDTILAVTWKQVIDGGTYTFSEVKIAHPSQFRRFLAGGEFGSDKLYITTEMARSANAVVASSGDFYSYRQAGTLVYDGQVRRVNNGLVDTCYIDANGDLLFTPRADSRSREEYQRFVDEKNILFSLAFGPILIQEGEVVTPDYYVIGEIHDHYPRSALCQLGKLHYLLAVVNAEGDAQQVPTLRRFGENLRNAGIRTAYTLDGGQTAVIAMDGKLINAVLFGYQRKISDIIYFATAMPGS